NARRAKRWPYGTFATILPCCRQNGTIEVCLWHLRNRRFELLGFEFSGVRGITAADTLEIEFASDKCFDHHRIELLAVTAYDPISGLFVGNCRFIRPL